MNKLDKPNASAKTADPSTLFVQSADESASAGAGESAGEIASDSNQPLADRLRPQSLAAVTGQDHLLGEGGALSRMLAGCKQGKPFPSLILWGAPGTGKTSIARLIAQEIGWRFEALSAVMAGVADLRRVFAMAETTPILLFIDEIHRFNKAQQDGLLAHVESGRVSLVGATTENPSFTINNALLSRCQVVVLNRLTHQDLAKLMQRAEHAYGRGLPLAEEARTKIIEAADGDGRYCLNCVERIMAEDVAEGARLTAKAVGRILAKRAANFDKAGEEHYNLISALHKSLRASDADAALYWFGRMVVAGEDLAYVLRRLVRFASEDVGLADPDAVGRGIAAWQSYERLGSPEGELAIAQLVLYLATAPKSNASYVAFKAAVASAKASGSLSPPAHILNAPTGLMKELGYGKGYVYDHDVADGFAGQNCFPEELPRQAFYTPVERGFEREVKKRLEWWQKKRAMTMNAEGKTGGGE